VHRPLNLNIASCTIPNHMRKSSNPLHAVRVSLPSIQCLVL
jgi:hypothetical protein